MTRRGAAPASEARIPAPGRDAPRVILWDVMDTLVREPFWVEMPAFFGLSPEAFRAEIHPTRWIEFEHGWIDEETYLRDLFRDGRAFDHAAFRAAVREAYAWLPGVEALLAGLRRGGHAMHALSNYSLWYRAIEGRLALSRFLQWSFVSCDTGLRKPAPEAFRLPCRRLGLLPSDCLLIDDREENCAAARAEGLDAIRFAGARALGPELERRGLGPGPPRT